MRKAHFFCLLTGFCLSLRRWEVQLTEETSQIKVVVSDGREGKDVSGTVKTYVSMEVVDLQVGSQKLANADPFALISLKDMKTYSVDEAIVSEESAKNIDIKFYVASNSGVITFRLYSPENVDGKNGEYAGSTGQLTALKKMNMTRFAKLPNFDYEQATRSSIEEEFGKATTAARADVNVGDIIGFKTGGSSSAGGGRIGVIKIVDISDKMGTDATKRIATVEIKFPKKK